MIRSALSFAALVLAPISHATVIAADGLACSGATQVAQAEGSGFGAAWIADNAESAVFAPQASSLAAPLGLAQSGGALYYDGTLLRAGGPLQAHYGARIYRDFDLAPGSTAATLGLLESHTTYFGNQQSGFGVPGTTVWLGYLFNGGSAGNGIAGVQYLAQVHLYDGLNTGNLAADDNNKDGEVLAVGRGNGNTQWNFERTCAHSPCGAITSSLGFVSTVNMDMQTHWVVLRFDFTSATTTAITLWLDPAPGMNAPDPATALALSGHTTNNVPALHFNWVEFGGQTATFSLDELRLATSYADLSTSAAPSSCGALFADGFE